MAHTHGDEHPPLPVCVHAPPYPYGGQHAPTVPSHRLSVAHAQTYGTHHHTDENTDPPGHHQRLRPALCAWALRCNAPLRDMAERWTWLRPALLILAALLLLMPLLRSLRYTFCRLVYTNPNFPPRAETTRSPPLQDPTAWESPPAGPDGDTGLVGSQPRGGSR